MTIAMPKICLHGEGPTDIVSRKSGAGLKFCLFSLLREAAAEALAGDSRGRYVEDAWTEELLEAGSFVVSRGELNRPARPGKFHKGVEEDDPELVRFANCAYFFGNGGTRGVSGFLRVFSRLRPQGARAVVDGVAARLSALGLCRGGLYDARSDE